MQPLFLIIEVLILIKADLKVHNKNWWSYLWDSAEWFILGKTQTLFCVNILLCLVTSCRQCLVSKTPERIPVSGIWTGHIRADFPHDWTISARKCYLSHQLKQR